MHSKNMMTFWDEDKRKIYEQAMALVTDKIREADSTLLEKEGSHIIRFVETRLKSEDSIAGKLKRKNRPYEPEHIENYLNDLAGVRAICFDKRQVYELVDIIRKCEEFQVLKEKDYIKKPKDNGYQSYHMILQISDVKVELQIRTILMDAWSSLETILVYKKDVVIPEELKENIQKFSKWSRKMDRLVEQMLEKDSSK